VFCVFMQVDVDHLVDTVRLNFPPLPVHPAAAAQQQQPVVAQQQLQSLSFSAAGGSSQPHVQQQPSEQQQPLEAACQQDSEQQQQTRRQHIVLAGTIQFSSALQVAKQRLSSDYPSLSIPKARPLSPGEVLGCTAPVLAEQGLGDADALVFVADGRFHLEAIMIANPTLPAYR
jgi:hypothetical protein